MNILAQSPIGDAEIHRQQFHPQDAAGGGSGSAAAAASALGNFRRVRYSPDGSAILATTDSGVVPVFTFSQSSAGSKVTPFSTAINTAEPTIDAVWCPFMTNVESDGTVLSCCRNTPLQLWDVNKDTEAAPSKGDDTDDVDEACRARYYAPGTNDYPKTAHALLWNATTMVDLVAGFEGGEICTFDVTIEGKGTKYKYASKKVSGIISALSYSPTKKFYALGSLTNNLVEFMDPNTNSCCAVLRGHRAGIIQIDFDDAHVAGGSSGGNYIITASRGCDNRVLTWDLRNVRSPVQVIERKTNFQQPIFFSCVSSAAGNQYIISGSADGQCGVARVGSGTTTVFTPSSNGITESELRNGGVCSVSAAPSTAATSSNSHSVQFALASGRRTFPVRDTWTERADLDSSSSSRKRRRAPLADTLSSSDDDDDDEKDGVGENTSSSSCTPYLAVASLTTP